jgi:hypothetical protein
MRSGRPKRGEELSDQRVDAIFAQNHSAEMAAYYMPETRSMLGSSLSPVCAPGFKLARRVRSPFGDRL